MESGDYISPNPQMESLMMRVATFCNLHESASLSPVMASNAGLYYTGEGDTVACYSCGLRLNHWESGVHPMTVHRRLSPECQFIVAQPTDNGSAEQNVSRTSRESPEMSQSHNNQRRRRRGYNSRHDYYSQLASFAGSLHASTGTSGDQTSYVSSQFSSTHIYTNVDRFPSRRTRERINNNDPTLLEEMKYERHRLSSYGNWPRDTNIAPEHLAEAGLFYLCRADRVKCAFCFGILRNWGPSEEPMRKHRKLFPRCPFLSDPLAAGNVAIGEEPAEECVLNVTSTASGGTTARQLGIETDRPKHPGMAVEAVRLASFDSWARSSPVTPESLARAGFYYTGVLGEVCCFFCSGYLNRWQTDDDPMTKHRHYYPNCGFVKLTTETERDNRCDTLPERENVATGDMVTTGDDGQQNAGASSQRTKLTCTVCLGAQKNVVFLPCRHFACCANCGSALSTCPVCRSAIQGYVYTFLA